MEQSPGTDLLLYMDASFDSEGQMRWIRYTDALMRTFNYHNRLVSDDDWTVKVQRMTGSKTVECESFHTFTDHEKALVFASGTLYNPGRSAIITNSHGMMYVMARVR